jgi:hypothetical protein
MNTFKLVLFSGFIKAIKILLTPLTIFKINTDEITTVMILALSNIQRVRTDIEDYKRACKIKRIPLNLKSITSILERFITKELRLSNDLECAMIIRKINI